MCSPTQRPSTSTWTMCRQTSSSPTKSTFLKVGGGNAVHFQPTYFLWNILRHSFSTQQHCWTHCNVHTSCSWTAFLDYTEKLKNGVFKKTLANILFVSNHAITHTIFYFFLNELWKNTKGASMRKPVLGACVGSATASLTKVHWWMHFQIPGWFCLIWLLLKKIMNQNWKCQADNEQILKCTLLLISRTISWNMNLFLMLRHTHLDVFW